MTFLKVMLPFSVSFHYFSFLIRLWCVKARGYELSWVDYLWRMLTLGQVGQPVFQGNTVKKFYLGGTSVMQWASLATAHRTDLHFYERCTSNSRALGIRIGWETILWDWGSSAWGWIWAGSSEPHTQNMWSICNPSPQRLSQRKYLHVLKMGGGQCLLPFFILRMSWND